MEGQWDADDDAPLLPRRDQPIPPPWFTRAEGGATPGPDEGAPRLRLSWPRAIGLLALVLLIIGIPLDFAFVYFSVDNALDRTPMTLGFVWAVVIEALAVWGLIRLMTRR
ncbi:hypothetical protein [Demequina sp.]|uniref:hypothetical protein n=1 Tax=Demequina sp. TaxID=2050685 RepID=UPI0025C49225|nr:hypothetical protein [Demequina sp.]